MELLVILAYAGILALVAPYVLPKSDFYGKLVPFSAAMVAGSVLWLILTWVGFAYDQAWIWFIVMLLMPAAIWFSTRYLHTNREQAEAKELEQIRLRGKA